MSDKGKTKNHVQIGTLGHKILLFSDIIEEPEDHNERDESKLNNTALGHKQRGITIKSNKDNCKGE